MGLGELIKKEIKRKGLTQRYVASKVGISDNAMSQICLGEALPHKKTIEKVCSLLRIRIDFTVTDVE